MVRSWALPPLRPTFDAAIRDCGSKDPQYRAMAAEALGHAEPDRAPAARAALLGLLADGSPLVRSNAAYALGVLGDEGAIAALVAAAKDQEPEVRVAVLDGLARLESAPLAEVATRALDDPDPEVRAVAVACLA